MKISLLFLTAILLCNTMFAQTTVKIYPVQSFVGISKKDNTYTKQSIDKEPKQFFIGYNSSNKTYGRGYLEFNLTGLPTNATINSARLQITSVIAWDTNFNGKFKVFTCPKSQDANDFTWNALVGNTAGEIGTFNFSKEGDGGYISNDPLKVITKNAIGKSLYLSLNQSDESKITRFTGNPLDLYLEVTYTTQGTSPSEPPANNEKISGPKEVFVGAEVGYYAIADKDLDRIQWDYDGNYFEFKRYDVYPLQSGIILMAKKSTSSTNVKVKVTAKDKEYSYMNFESSISIKIKPIPQYTIKSNSGDRACNNSNVTYQIDGIIPDGSKIIWTPISNLTYISGQNTNQASFKATGSGYAEVKVDIEYLGKTYTQINSNIWIGPEPTPKIGGALGESGSYAAPNEEYNFSTNRNANIIRYRWGYGGGTSLNYTETTINNVTLKTTSKGLFKVTLSVQNSCGWSNVARNTYTVDPNASLKSILTANEEDQPEIKSIKIYNLSGGLVYSNNSVNSSFDIKSTSLKDGIYIIEKFNGQNRTSEKVILKR